MIKKHFFFLVIALIFINGLMVGFWRAPQQETNWSQPFRLSSEQGKSSEASLVADPYGFVHVFWAEEMPDGRTLVQYARFDGQTWSYPVDIYVAGLNNPINSISSFVDANGMLRVIWSEGLFPKFLRYTYAPATDALSSSKWAKPNQFRLPIEQVDLLVDDEGVFHVIYTDTDEDGHGVFYIQSRDQAQSWSNPLWLDPDTPADLFPDKLTFALDDAGGMHAVWFYKTFEESKGDWVRYIHSLDQGATWSAPFTLAKNSEGADELNAFAAPVMTVSGQTIHAIWAGGDLLYRHYRSSSDAGKTWTEPIRILGELNGQAFDGIAVDGLGRPHFISQIRFPVGIYHSVLNNNKWTFPELIYFIRFSNADKSEDLVEAHATFPKVRLGNQIVLTFTDPPPDENRGLYVMTTFLDDVPPLTPAFTPTPALTATPVVTGVVETATTPLATDVPTATPVQGDVGTQSIGSPNQALVLGMVFSFVLVVGVLVLRQLLRR